MEKIDEMIGLSTGQCDHMKQLIERAERDFPGQLAMLRSFFDKNWVEDRKKLSWLYHNLRVQHAAEQALYLKTITVAIAETENMNGLWAVLFLYFGWVRLMVRKIERRASDHEGPTISPTAFVYAMF